MVQHDGTHDEGMGEKMEDAVRALKQKLGGHSDDETMRDDSLRTESRMRDGEDERRLTLAEEELAVGKRRVQAGEVHISKHVETEHVQEDVPVMREEVVVERHAMADSARAGDVEIGEQEISIPVTEEEVVAEKRPVVKEEIVARKREVEGSQTVDADLRQERVDIEDETRTKAPKGSRSKSSARGSKRSDDSGRTGR